MSDVAPAFAACPAHPDRPAAGVCARCGRFVCSECRGAAGPCPECRQFLLSRLPDGAGRARWATYFLIANIGMCALSVVVAALKAVGTDSEMLSDAVALAALATFGALVGGAITYLRWLHLAVRTTVALGARVGASPAWAVGSFFVPIANLYQPYKVIRAMCDRLGGAASTAPVGSWWATWILSGLMGLAETRAALGGDASAARPLGVEIADAGLTIAAAVLCISVVRAVQRELDARRGGGAPQPTLGHGRTG